MNEKMIKIVINSDIKNVFLIGAVVNRLCTLAPFSDVEIFQIELSVVESVNNAIQHAYSNESGHEVGVVFILHCNRITFEICDSGKSMNSQYFHKKGEPSFGFDPDDIENLPEGGMGLLIINQIMDQVVYTTSNGINKLILTKFFSADKTTR
jgi:anti-sigma regulatory factor (Ser/Thr protein kinase)